MLPNGETSARCERIIPLKRFTECPYWTNCKLEDKKKVDTDQLNDRALVTLSLDYDPTVSGPLWSANGRFHESLRGEPNWKMSRGRQSPEIGTKD